MSKNERRKKKLKRQKYLRTRALAILVVVGVGAMLGMALFNGHAKPNRDMHWYMKPGAMDVAVPGPSDGYVVAEANVGQRDGSATPALAELEASPDAEGSADIPADAEASGASAASEAGDVAAEVSDGTESLDPADDSAQDAADAFEDGESGEADAETAVEEIPTGPVTITVTAAGDCTFGGQDGAKGRRRFMEYAKDYGYDYFFNGVRSIFENDDLTIVNLEGPLTRLDRTDRHANFIFHGDPEYANILTGSSVELCNVANNHSRDYGTEGLKETASVLDAAGVGYCGYNKAYYTTIKGVRVGALGFTWWDYNTRQMSKAVAEVRKNCDLLIVSVH